MSDRTVIVGGGLGALRTAQALRDEQYDGDVMIVSAESVLPYDRPPLSKSFLLEGLSEDRLLLTSAADLAASRIEFCPESRGIALDLEQNRVTLEHGDELSYDALVVATGARPIRLPMFHGLEGVAYLRDLHDARRLRAELLEQPRVGIVGGGFIGLEIAVAARARGCEVTIVELARTPLAGILGEQMGAWVQAWHEQHGVRFRCGTPLTAARGDVRPEQLILADGSAVEVDLVVVGVGVRPEVDWLTAAGLSTHIGLVCDGAGRTSDPNVFGVGDVTCRHADGACMPSGHWTATNEQARAAAATVLGRAAHARSLRPGYFWSDQYDHRLQFAGAVTRSARFTVSSGALEEQSFVALLRDEEEVTGVFAIDSARDFVKTSRLALSG